jgi:hypothetical protein
MSNIQTTRRVMGILNKDSVSLIINGTHTVRTTRDGFDPVEIMRAIQAYNASPSDETWDALQSMVNPAAQILKDAEGTNGILETDGENYFLKGIRVALPKGLLEALMRFFRAGLDPQPLVNFWTLCVLNPNKEARDAFFGYCDRFNVTITPAGYAVLYKAVRPLRSATDDGLAEFIATEVVRRRRQKKGLSRFTVYSLARTFASTEGNIPEGAKDLGNLAELNDKIDEMEGAPVYTSIHPSNVEYRIGEVASITRRDDHNAHLCGPGVLHVGHESYVRNFGSSPESVILTTLVDPSNVMAVPKYDSSKMGVSEFFITGIVERDANGDWQEIDSPFFEDNYIAYEEDKVKELAQGIETDLTRAFTSETKQVATEAAALRLQSVYS